MSMSIRGSHAAALALSSVMVLASCQGTVGVAGGGNGTAVGVSTTVGRAVDGVYFTRNLMWAVPDPSVPGRFEVRDRKSVV